jgi:NAD(P)-dependent dehydrogenase (short-subunit alcohol dehydrogenase family)
MGLTVLKQENTMRTLSNKVVVITGGTSGIGLATARLFVEEGANVAIFSRNDDTLQTVAKKLGENAIAVRGDVTQAVDLERLFNITRERFGKIDVLFANAALVKLAPIEQTDDQLYDEVVNTNMKGTFNTLKHALPALNEHASVILTTSYFNRIGFPGASAVSMTKAAVRSLVRVAAAELAPRHIRVNALCPGAIETPLWGKLGLSAGVLGAAAKHIIEKTPAGRFGTAEELARAALFLASDASSFVNGSELSVDGGLHQV